LTLPLYGGGFTVTATKTVKLKDQTEVLIRPMTRDDLERSHDFFCALPEEDRAYLRRDVTKLEVIEERVREMEQGNVKRLIALVDDKIVADGALELSGHAWKQHLGELRLIVARPYQHKGLGMLMMRALYDIARSTGLEEIVIKMMGTQTAARNICERLGFRQNAVLRNYLKDRGGTKRDLILMRCDLEELWRDFEALLYEMDSPGWRID
jgi:RimJ/RimL family protein N-acetyltransferase